VRRHLAPTRSSAQELIRAGRVTVSGAPTDKSARLVDPSESVVVLGEPPRFVGRGGEKLAAALERMGIDVDGRRVLDAGASTGGFVDCLLRYGAESVIAVDVGRGQLHERMAGDPRVIRMDRVNVRDLEPDDVGGTVEVLTADLSFISLVTVADALLGLTALGGELVLLVKPQFEGGRKAAARGRGVIRDPLVWKQSLERVMSAYEERGATMMGAMVSPVRGADGNVEFFLHLRAPDREAA
jgi:23S rRNA (cytidine1920-2'-O)/16S rRNA (cytidine1409-2'-O)-methyltransferase